MDECLGKYYKIKSSKEIISILRKGKCWRDDHISVHYVENSFQNDRFAVLVSKKHGKSWKRNKIKRLIREVFRKNKTENPACYNILIRPRIGEKPEIASYEASYLAWRKSLSE